MPPSTDRGGRRTDGGKAIETTHQPNQLPRNMFHFPLQNRFMITFLRMTEFRFHSISEQLLLRDAVPLVLGLDIGDFCQDSLKLFSVAPNRPCFKIRSGFFRKLDVWPRGHFLKCRENIEVSPASPSTGWLYEFSPEFPFSFGVHSEVAPHQIFSRILYSSKFTSLGLKIVITP